MIIILTISCNIRQFFRLNSHNTMLTANEHLVALHTILVTKTKVRLPLQSLQQLFQHGSHLKRLNDRGLFLLFVAQILKKQYIHLNLLLQKFVSDLLFRQVTVRKKESGRRKRRTRHNKENKDANLEELSNDAVENPANIEQPRLQDVQRGNEDSSLGVNSKSSKESGDNSKDSKDLAFKEELKKISEVMRGEDTLGMSMGLDQYAEFDVEVSSSNRSAEGFISNVDQKLKIFGEETFSITRDTKTRRKSGIKKNRDTITKKKNQLVDQHTIIEEETKLSIENSMNETKIAQKHIEIARLYQQFCKNILEKEELLFSKEQILTEANIGRMKDFFNFQKQPYNARQFQSQFPSDIQLPDYTVSTSLKYDPWIHIEKDKIALGFLQTDHISLNDISMKTGKTEIDVFHEMLWRCQRGEVELTQKHPQSFSTIFIRSIPT